MIEFLYTLDVAVLRFINVTLSTSAGDLLWPLVTDYDKFLPVRIVLIAVWLLLLVRGGARGRTVALMVIPLLVISDKLTNAVIKEIVGRLRPCHQVGGIPVVQGLHMLVDCGPGKSFPSSHAVNNFAVATAFSFYYPRWRFWFLGFASLVALSRPAVGVHYPSDILGGALLGAALAAGVIALWGALQRRLFPRWGIEPPGGGTS
jgi:undecaprenyl-diphosphatase